MIAGRPDRVQIWASQLAANDFPPICVMTGRPAETWRKFRFATPPAWVYWLLVLICLGGFGLIAFAVAMTVTAQRATGFLPLTRASRRTIELVIWVPAGLICFGILASIAGAIVGLSTSDSALGTIGGIIFLVGLLALLGGLAGRLIITRLVGPRARVQEPTPGQLDKLVELRNVNPAFVVAVNQMHVARAARMTQPN